jgi:hypothetical protein
MKRWENGKLLENISLLNGWGRGMVSLSFPLCTLVLPAPEVWKQRQDGRLQGEGFPRFSPVWEHHQTQTSQNLAGTDAGSVRRVLTLSGNECVVKIRPR